MKSSTKRQRFFRRPALGFGYAGLGRKDVKARKHRAMRRRRGLPGDDGHGHCPSSGRTRPELIRHSRESGNRRGPWRHCEAVEPATLHRGRWCNHRRLFEPLGHVPPAAFEAHYSHPLRESAMAPRPKPISLRDSRDGSPDDRDPMASAGNGRVDRSIHRGGMVEAGSEFDPGSPVSGRPGEAQRPPSPSVHGGGCRAMPDGEERR